MTQYKVSFRVSGDIIVEGDDTQEASETAKELIGDANNDLGEIVYVITACEEVPEEESDDEEIAAGDVLPTIAEQLDGIEVTDLSVDEDGQLVFYPTVYQWADGTYHTTQEPIVSKNQ